MDALAGGFGIIINVIGAILELLLRFWKLWLALLILLIVLMAIGSGTTTKTQPRQSTQIVLYHYTDHTGMVQILQDGAIRASASSVKYGQGVFLTDLPPTGLLAANDLATALYSNSKGSIYVQHYLELAVDTSLIYRQGSVVWQKLPKGEQALAKAFSIYRIAGNQPLLLAGNLITTGDTLFKP